MQEATRARQHSYGQGMRAPRHVPSHPGRRPAPHRRARLAGHGGLRPCPGACRAVLRGAGRAHLRGHGAAQDRTNVSCGPANRTVIRSSCFWFREPVRELPAHARVAVHGPLFQGCGRALARFTSITAPIAGAAGRVRAPGQRRARCCRCCSPAAGQPSDAVRDGRGHRASEPPSSPGPGRARGRARRRNTLRGPLARVLAQPSEVRSQQGGAMHSTPSGGHPTHGAMSSAVDPGGLKLGYGVGLRGRRRLLDIATGPTASSVSCVHRRWQPRRRRRSRPHPACCTGKS